MSIFWDFVNRLGEKYYDDFEKVCYDNRFNNEFIFKNGFVNKDQYISSANKAMFYYWLSSEIHNTYLNKESGLFVSNSYSFSLNINVISSKVKYFDDIESKEVTLNKIKELSKTIDTKSIIENKNKQLDNTRIKKYLKETIRKDLNHNTNNINILLICVDTQRFIYDVSSLINEMTGIYSSNSHINLDKYKDIDFIIISNCSEAHINPKLKLNNLWDFDNYIKFVLPLKLNDDELQVKKNNYVSKLFNDNFMKFYSYISNNKKELDFKNRNLGILSLNLSDYILKNFDSK